MLSLSKKSERKSSIKASSLARPAVKPKSSLSRTSFESGQGDDDLSLLSSSAKATESTQQIKEDDIFMEARSKTKASMRYVHALNLC